MSITTEERDRITARLPKVLVEKLQEAADLTGATLNQFLVQAAVEKADKIIDRERAIRFTAEDAAMFIHMLDNPRPPNEAVTRAFERLRKVEDGSNSNSAEQGA
ncbi:DUF1778 domain-containing protein [Massilia sp. YIM B04103]|uniref:type II toxin-antitoxin system TacA family antitoxin n=1 Tax=Massilia sp. YIM B04103 TaxID=2963106 RepID=UPI00210A9A63|nr:DUF1778 domain-containing protein [Massilia sp. YIM B04103]